MARTLGELKQIALELLHENPTSTVFTTTLVPSWVQEAVDDILTHTDWKWNTGFVELTWPAASGEASVLYLPEYVDKIFPPYPDAAEGVGSIDIVGAWELDRYRPGAGSTFGRSTIVLWGLYWVEADMPAAGTITATSGAGAAGNGVQVRLEGRDANDREIRETLTLAGAGTATSTATFAAGVDGIRRISLIGGTGAATGVITCASGGTTLAVLDSVWEKFQEHQRTEYYGGGTGGTTAMTLRFYRKHRRLEADTEYLPLPESFDRLVELFLAAKIGQFRGQQDEHLMLMGEYTSALAKMVRWDNRQPGVKRQLYVRPQWGWRRRGGYPG